MSWAWLPHADEFEKEVGEAGKVEGLGEINIGTGETGIRFDGFTHNDHEHARGVFSAREIAGHD